VASRTHRPNLTSNAEKNTKYKFQKALLNKHFHEIKDNKRQKDYRWQMDVPAELIYLQL
jgi:hypothetical protein